MPALRLPCLGADLRPGKSLRRREAQPVPSQEQNKNNENTQSGHRQGQYPQNKTNSGILAHTTPEVKDARHSRASSDSRLTGALSPQKLPEFLIHPVRKVLDRPEYGYARRYSRGKSEAHPFPRSCLASSPSATVEKGLLFPECAAPSTLVQAMPNGLRFAVGSPPQHRSAPTASRVRGAPSRSDFPCLPC